MMKTGCCCAKLLMMLKLNWLGLTLKMTVLGWVVDNINGNDADNWSITKMTEFNVWIFNHGENGDENGDENRKEENIDWLFSRSSKTMMRQCHHDDNNNDECDDYGGDQWCRMTLIILLSQAVTSTASIRSPATHKYSLRSGVVVCLIFVSFFFSWVGYCLFIFAATTFALAINE